MLHPDVECRVLRLGLFGGDDESRERSDAKCEGAVSPSIPAHKQRISS